MGRRIYVYGSGLLTSDSSGDATATIECPPGILLGVMAVNIEATKPSNNWDVALTNTINGVSHTLLDDDTISQTGTTVWMPSIEGNLGSDGSSQTLTELRIPTWGNITVTAANMGSGKNAYIYVMIES